MSVGTIGDLHFLFLGAVDLVRGVGVHNWQYVLSAFLHFFLESFDLVGGIGGHNRHFAFFV